MPLACAKRAGCGHSPPRAFRPKNPGLRQGAPQTSQAGIRAPSARRMPLACAKRAGCGHSPPRAFRPKNPGLRQGAPQTGQAGIRAPSARRMPLAHREASRVWAQPTQPLTAPAVTPSMNWLCARKNTIRDGRIEISETAITRFHAKPVSASMLMRTNSVAG